MKPALLLFALSLFGCVSPEERATRVSMRPELRDVADSGPREQIAFRPQARIPVRNVALTE